MSDTQDVEALVARLERFADAEDRGGCVELQMRTSPCREAATALRTATLLIGKAESRASSLEAQLAGAKEFVERHPALSEADRAEFRAFTKLSEALASAPASAGVRVKALKWHVEWHGDNDSRMGWTGRDQHGYSVWVVAWKSDEWRVATRIFSDLGAAKAAAQADYEARIRSCLTPSEGRDGKEDTEFLRRRRGELVRERDAAREAVRSLIDAIGNYGKTTSLHEWSENMQRAIVDAQNAIAMNAHRPTTPEASHDR